MEEDEGLPPYMPNPQRDLNGDLEAGREGRNRGEEKGSKKEGRDGERGDGIKEVGEGWGVSWVGMICF